MPELAISPEKAGFLIGKAREFDAKDLPADPETGSNPTDDNEIDVLEENSCDPVVREITAFIHALNEDEQIDLVALTHVTNVAVVTGAPRAPHVICSASPCWVICWPRVSANSEYHWTMSGPCRS